MSRIHFEGVSKAYRGKTALDRIDLDIEPACLTVVSGPPGCGKSVLARILIGLEAPSAGRILFDGEDITQTPAAERSIGYVPQSFALFPHMSVFDNIAYPMALQGVRRSDISKRVDQAAGILQIGPLLAKRPSQLSGGEKQRAAIARGLLKNANIFILDDPLVGLDFKLRESLMEDLKDLRAEIDATFLYITSDPLDALTMAEHLVIMDRGRLVEAGPVDAVYYDPTCLRAIELVGFPRCNVLPAQLDATNMICATAIGELPITLKDGPTAPEAMVAIRPEDIAPPAAGAAPLGIGIVTLVENLGSESIVYVQLNETTLVTTVPAGVVGSLDIGGSFPLAVLPGGPTVFDRASGRRIGRIASPSEVMRNG